MKKIMAIALDLDGTLLNSAKEVSTRNMNALLKCHSLGIQIIIATARPPRSVKSFLPQALLDISSMIYYNGSVIEIPKLNINEHLFISSDLTKQVYNSIIEHNPCCYVSFEVDNQQYSDRILERAQLKVFGIPDHFPVPDVLENIGSIDVTKILLPNFNIFESLHEQFKDKLNLLCTDQDTLIQIMHKDASKEAALTKVLLYLNISPAWTAAFGDDTNDLGMLKMCGYSVAMGNSIDILKQSAKLITDTNDQDGVAVMLERIINFDYIS